MSVRTIMATLVISAAAIAIATTAAAQGAKPQSAKAAPATKAAGGRIVAITGDDTMKFSVTTIDAKPGETITIKLTNKGAMPKAASAHNFVLLKLGTDVNTFTMAAVMAAQTGYVPTGALKAQVVASSGLAGPGESVEVTFKVPAARGAYDFLCSFPGHFATMKGTLNVK